MRLSASRLLVLYERGPNRALRVRCIAATGEQQLYAASLAVVRERAEAGVYGPALGQALAAIEAGGAAAYTFLLSRRAESGESIELRFVEEP